MEIFGLDLNEIINMVMGAAVPVVIYGVVKLWSKVRAVIAASSNKIDDAVLSMIEEAVRKALDEPKPAQTPPPAAPVS